MSAQFGSVTSLYYALRFMTRTHLLLPLLLLAWACLVVTGSLRLYGAVRQDLKALLGCRTRLLTNRTETTTPARKSSW